MEMEERLEKRWKREREQKSLRKLSKEIGVSYALLHRFEVGHNLLASNYNKIMAWLSK